MPQAKKPILTIRDRRLARRQRQARVLLAKELRPITIWVWDADAPAFRAEARRQMEHVRNSVSEREFAEIWAPNQDTRGWVWGE